MKALTEALKTMLNALAHEDAGEYLTPSQKTAILGKGPGATPEQRVAPTVQEPAPVGRRRVALFTGRELPENVIEYVTETCARTEHDLTVLTFETESTAEAMLQPYQGDLAEAGIDVKLVTLGGNTLSQLARYLGSHPEIAFLACKESGYLGRSYLDGNQRKNEMPVPVVVIVSGKEAVQLPDAGADVVEADKRIA
jgi:hypothetical protein